MGIASDRLNVFEQIESVKRLLQPIIFDGDSFKIRGIVRCCIRFRLGITKQLKKEESEVYDLLLKNNLNCKTVYEWFLLEQVPSHIKEKIVKNKIGLKAARWEYVQWKHLSGTRAGNMLMDEMREVIRRLRWKSQEELPPQW